MNYFIKHSLKYAFKDTFSFPPWVCFSLFVLITIQMILRYLMDDNLLHLCLVLIVIAVTLVAFICQFFFYRKILR